MIIDDDVPAFQATPAPITGADFVSLTNRILNSNLPDAERTRLLTRANDYRDAMTDAETNLASLTESIRERAAASTQSAADNLTFLSGLYRGHADRISQESVDALGKIVVNAQANARRRIQAGEQLLWQTPARPVARRSETAVINTMDPGDAAAYMIQSRMESSPGIPANNSPLGDIEQQPGATSDRPSNESVIEAATALGISLRTPIDETGNPVGLTPSPGSGGVPIDPPLGCSIGNDAADPAYLHPGTSWGSVTTLNTPPAQLLGILQLARANGATILFSPLLPPSGTNSLWLGDVTAFFPDGSSFTYGLTYGQLNPGQSQDDPWNGFAGYTPDYLPVHIRSASLETCAPGTPISPPPPPPPSTSPPPPSEPPTANPACCPPDPAERDDGNASRKFPEWPGESPEGRDWCNFITAFTLSFAGSTPALPDPDGGGTGYGDDAEQNPWWANWIAEKADQVKTDIQDIFGFAKDPVVGSPLEAMNAAQVMNQKLMKSTAITLKTDKPELEGKTAALLASYSLVSWAEKFTGAPLMYLGRNVEHAVKYIYPREIPGQSEVNQAWLANKIGNEEWECLTRSNGNISQLAAKVRDSQVTLLNPNDYVELFMRDQLTFPELRSKLRPLGIVSDDVISEMIELRVQIPQFADIIRFMVRDTENAQVVQEGRLDDGFEVNFTGVLEQWARQQGLDSSVALRYWRAHWELPSPTMAFEMLRRLRPGRVPDDIAVTYDQVQRLLSAADYAPGWREKMTAVSYLTPTRTDIKQGYSRGVYDRPTIIEMLQDTGLDQAGAEAVAKLYDFEKEQFQRTRTERASAFTVKTVLAGYIAGTLNRREAEFLLDGFGFSPERKKTTLDSADLRSVMDTRQKCIRAVRRRYYVGAIDEPTAVKELMDRDIDQGQAEELVNGWSCERSANLQEVPARKNLQWAVDGVITILELETRLKRLRYSADDIARYVAEAEKRISDAVAKAIEKQVRDMLAEQRRRLAEAKAKLKDFEDRVKEAEKKAKEAEKKAGGG